MPSCALPSTLQGVKHNDWPFFLRWIQRGANARGPRCPSDSPGYLAWPPRLVEGAGVTRWELAGAGSIVEFKQFRDHVKAKEIYGFRWTGIERNPGNAMFGREVRVPLEDPLNIGCAVRDLEIEPGVWQHTTAPNFYSPSALQIFSDEGWMRLDPHFTARWKVLKRSPEGEPLIAPNFRYGWRPDHLDVYYNWGPYAGLKFE